MNIICDHYYALKWKNKIKGFCCVNGQIVLASLSQTPPVLYYFLTSLGANIDQEFANARGGVYTLYF